MVFRETYAAMNHMTAVVVALICAESKAGFCARLALTVLNLGIGALLLHAANVLRYDLHSVVWFHHLPQVVLFMAMLSNAMVFLIAVRIRCLRQTRALLDKYDGWNNRLCEPSPGHLRLCIALAMLLCAVTLGMGAALSARGLQVQRELGPARCGRAGVAHALEAEHRRLMVFHRYCQQQPEHQSTTVGMCPGFRATFPPPSSHVAYLAHLEVYENCAGFCSPAKPLFTAAGPDAAPLACADVAARKLRLVSRVVGASAMVIGATFMVTTLFFLVYKDL